MLRCPESQGELSSGLGDLLGLDGAHTLWVTFQVSPPGGGISCA